MPKENLTSKKPSVEKLVKEVEALKKPPENDQDVTETAGTAKASSRLGIPGVGKKIPDISKLNLASSKIPVASIPFASGSNKMSWIVGGVVISMMMGLLVGYFVMKSLWAPPVEEPLPGPTSAELSQPKTVTMHGVIRPLEASIYMEETHQLIGDNGEMLAILKPSGKIQDLTFLEGSEVDVEGEASETTEGDMTIIKVDKVRF